MNISVIEEYKKFMKVKINISFIILIILILGFIGGCSQKKEIHNLIITNSSGYRLKSIGFYKHNSSGGVSNADNSLIEYGEKVNLYMESNEFSLKVIDENDKEYISQKFNIDFKNKNNKIYSIDIENDSLEGIEFILDK